MKYNFTILEVLKDALTNIKVDAYENPQYKKTLVLLEIWETQKSLGFLFDQYDSFDKNININCGGSASTLEQKSSYKEQYIKFLMVHDLVFIAEVKDSNVLLNLIFYWILADVKKDKQLLDNF